jgi:hypothetical protein
VKVKLAKMALAHAGSPGEIPTHEGSRRRKKKLRHGGRSFDERNEEVF